MKIISKFKDYYDYLVGKYGEDPILVFDRRNNSPLPQGVQQNYLHALPAPARALGFPPARRGTFLPVCRQPSSVSVPHGPKGVHIV